MSLRKQWLLLVLMAAAGCATTAAVREYIDQDTAATVTIAAENIVFARERTDLAVHAQDYITITPVQINRGGNRVVYLYCQLWSTIDRRGDKGIVPAHAQLALVADDRRIPLPASATDTRRLGFGRMPFDAPNKWTEVRASAIDVDLLRFIVNAGQLRVAMTTDTGTEYFLLWRDGRGSARQFLQHVDAVRQ